jgi:chromosomal replication initiation ATPase DnaA
MTTFILGRRLRRANAARLLSAYSEAGIDLGEPTFAEFVVDPLPGPVDHLPELAVRIRRLVAKSFGMSEHVLMSRSMEPHIVHPRLIACWMIKKLVPSISAKTAARCLGRFDHTTALNACRVVPKRIRADESLKARVDAIHAQLMEEER